jgi:hypothetical protein
MFSTTNTHRIAVAFATSVAALLCMVILWPAASPAAEQTQTLRVFSKLSSMTLTHADGTVVDRPPFPEVQPGDVLDIYSVDYRGTHRRHSKRPIGSDHLHCVFGTGEPTCTSHVAIGGSMLIIDGNPGTVVGGTGRFEGATGRVLSNKEVPGGVDAVARVTLRR